MLEVKINDRFGFAKDMFERNNDVKLVALVLTNDHFQTSYEMSIPEAEKLVKELQEWIHEFRD